MATSSNAPTASTGNATLIRKLERLTGQTSSPPSDKSQQPDHLQNLTRAPG